MSPREDSCPEDTNVTSDQSSVVATDGSQANDQNNGNQKNNGVQVRVCIVFIRGVSRSPVLTCAVVVITSIGISTPAHMHVMRSGTFSAAHSRSCKDPLTEKGVVSVHSRATCSAVTVV